MPKEPSPLTTRPTPKFPVARLAQQIEHEWTEELAAYLEVPAEDVFAKPTTMLSYPSETVRVELMDGSSVEFKWAFALVSEEKKAIAVFTEHCGHHVYPFHEARVFRGGRLVYDQANPRL